MNPTLQRFLIHSGEILFIAALSGIVAALISLVPSIESILPTQYALLGSVLIPLLLSALKSAQAEIANEQTQLENGKLVGQLKIQKLVNDASPGN